MKDSRIIILFILAFVCSFTYIEKQSWHVNTAYAGEIKWPWMWGNPPDGVSEKRYGRRRRAITGPVEDGVRPVWTSGKQSCRQIMSHSLKQAPIHNDFMRYFHQCAGASCRPNKVYGMWGCRASGRSCHHSGQAVDIGGYKCGGRQVNFGTRTFDRFVSCMVQKGGFRKLYKCKDHWDHAHFSRGCAQRKI